jgi:hypothetical protein
MAKFYISLLLFSWMLASCIKEEEEPPMRPKNEGPVNFTAMVDSVSFACHAWATGAGCGLFQVNAHELAQNGVERSIQLYFPFDAGKYYFVTPGTYPLYGFNKTGAYFVGTGGKYNHQWLVSATTDYYSPYTHTGSVTITKCDPANQLLSGTFQFNARNSLDSAQTICITQGVFNDVKWEKQ